MVKVKLTDFKEDMKKQIKENAKRMGKGEIEAINNWKMKTLDVYSRLENTMTEILRSL